MGFPQPLAPAFTQAITSTSDITARSGAATAVAIGAVAPGSASGITFQNGEAGSNLYRSGAGAITLDGVLTVSGGVNAGLTMVKGIIANSGGTAPVYVGYANGCGIGDANNSLLVRFDGTGKLGFYNTVPVAQAAAITAPAATAATNVTPWGYSTQAQADAIVTAVRALQLAVKNIGITA